MTITSRPFYFFPRFLFFPFLLLPFVFFSCGSSDGTFRLEGRFKNLNQGEFYLYDLEEGTIDTLVAKDGRFSFVRNLTDTVTLQLLFPNFSEMPIFARPGAHVKIDGDVSHLKETEISGTEDNEQMTAFRLRTADMMPPEVAAEAEALICQDPASPVGPYLLRRYFLLAPTPDYAKCYALCDTLLAAQPTNIPLVRLHAQLKGLRHRRSEGRLPVFSAVTADGDSVGNRQLKSEVNVVYLWASWSFDTQAALRQLHQLQKEHRGRLSVVTICLDATPGEGRHVLERDSITWPNVCDGRMWQSPLLAQLGMATVADNIVADRDGRIVARNLDSQELQKQLEELLK